MDYFCVTSSVNSALSVVLPATVAMTYMVGWIIVSYSLIPVSPLPTIQGDSLEIRLAAGGLLNTGKINAFAYSRY